MIQSNAIQQMVEDLFVSMLGLPIAPTDEGVQQSDDSLQASIHIDGEWEAEVRVISTKEVATRIACAMFAAEVADLDDSDTHDALGEIVNVIGGNIKGIVDRDCNLSIPQVAPLVEDIGRDWQSHAINCCGGALHIVLLQK